MTSFERTDKQLEALADETLQALEASVSEGSTLGDITTVLAFMLRKLEAFEGSVRPRSLSLTTAKVLGTSVRNRVPRLVRLHNHLNTNGRTATDPCEVGTGRDIYAYRDEQVVRREGNRCHVRALVVRFQGTCCLVVLEHQADSWNVHLRQLWSEEDCTPADRSLPASHRRVGLAQLASSTLLAGESTCELLRHGDGRDVGYLGSVYGGRTSMLLTPEACVHDVFDQLLMSLDSVCASLKIPE